MLFISGTGGDLRQSPSIFDSFLARHFQILAYDQRGLGLSDRPDIPYTMSDYATDADRLLGAVGWDDCFVMGISFGGMVAQEFALNYPQRVKKLVLGCTSSGGAGGDSYPLHNLSHLPIRERATRIVVLSDTRRDENWQVANPEMFQEFIDMTVARFSVGAGEPGRETGARRQLEARLGHDTYARLPHLNMPVLVCGGRYDSIAPMANLEAICSRVPQARLELFEGGHLFFLQDPKAFETIRLFLTD